LFFEDDVDTFSPFPITPLQSRLGSPFLLSPAANRAFIPPFIFLASGEKLEKVLFSLPFLVAPGPIRQIARIGLPFFSGVSPVY